jgi:ABC-type bacteriocin/lantibiotic exporter with double-glycine peptidase domain
MLRTLVLSFAREVVLLAAPFYMQMTVDEVIARGDLDLLTVLALGFALLVGGPQKTWPARASRFPRVVREGGG